MFSRQDWMTHGWSCAHAAVYIGINRKPNNPIHSCPTPSLRVWPGVRVPATRLDHSLVAGVLASIQRPELGNIVASHCLPRPPQKQLACCPTKVTQTTGIVRPMIIKARVFGLIVSSNLNINPTDVRRLVFSERLLFGRAVTRSLQTSIRTSRILPGKAASYLVR